MVLVPFVVWTICFLCSLGVLAWVYTAIFEGRVTRLHIVASLVVGVVWLVFLLHSWKFL